MRITFFLLMSLLGSLASASDFEKSRSAYLAIRDDGDLFVGEGQVWLKDEGNDPGQAEAVAAARAKGSLAQAIEVRVQSATEVEAVSSPLGSSETAKSWDKASSDLKLGNVKTQTFGDFPKKGQVTVLAWISKEDWRRQMKGKGPVVYRPENGIRIMVGNWFPGEYAHFAMQHVNEQKNFGLGLVWSHWVIEGMIGNNRLTPPNANHDMDQNSAILHAGYEWTPFSWRVQPYLPLGVGYVDQQLSVEGANDFSGNFGAYAGLGARYWPSDSFALEISARNYFPFNRTQGDPMPYHSLSAGYAPDTALNPVFELSGWGFNLQVLWSAF